MEAALISVVAFLLIPGAFSAAASLNLKDGHGHYYADHEFCNQGSIAVRTQFTGEGIDVGDNVVPVYRVSIENTGCTSCLPSNLHLHCGLAVQSLSAKPLDPRLFRMLSKDDCLVNDGRPLPFNSPIEFEYASLVEFTLGFKSATFCP